MCRIAKVQIKMGSNNAVPGHIGAQSQRKNVRPFVHGSVYVLMVDFFPGH